VVSAEIESEVVSAEIESEVVSAEIEWLAGSAGTNTFRPTSLSISALTHSKYVMSFEL